MATRKPTSPLPYSTTDKKYDFDYNIVDSDEEGPFLTPTYQGGVAGIPAEIFEKLIHLICSQPHQGLMMFHQMIQGIKTVFLKIKSFIQYLFC